MTHPRRLSFVVGTSLLASLSIGCAGKTPNPDNNVHVNEGPAPDPQVNVAQPAEPPVETPTEEPTETPTEEPEPAEDVHVNTRPDTR